MATNQVTPPPLDNEPKPSNEKTAEKLRAWISDPTWQNFKSWLGLIYKVLKGIQSDSSGNITLTGNLTVDGSLNGLPVEDAGLLPTGVLTLIPGNAINKYQIVSSTPFSIANSTATGVCGIFLPAGTWDVGGIVNFTPTGATGISAMAAAINTVNSTFAGSIENVQQGTWVAGVQTFIAPETRVTVTGISTQIYLIGQVNFSGSGMNTNGVMWAKPVYPF